MVEKVFHYTDPRYLNLFINYISGDNCEVSAMLWPDIPEYIKERDSANELIGHDKMYAILMAQLSKKYNIRFFQGLVFDNSSRQNNDPQIKYLGPRVCSYQDEPYAASAHPCNFTGDKKWQSIQFKDFQGEESVIRAQLGIAEFVKQGYVVVNISAKLNPRIRTADHYCDYKEYDASLWAGGGEITLSGKIPDDYDLPKEPREIKSKSYMEEFESRIVKKLLDAPKKS